MSTDTGILSIGQDKVKDQHILQIMSASDEGRKKRKKRVDTG